MFRKLKDRISVVGEDIKNDPRFQNGLASVNKVASDTLAAINKSESGQSLQDQVQLMAKKAVRPHPKMKQTIPKPPSSPPSKTKNLRRVGNLRKGTALLGSYYCTIVR